MDPTRKTESRVTPSWRRRTVHGSSLGLLVAGVVLHLTVRDAIRFPVAGLYYGLPRPVLLILSCLVLWTATKWKWFYRLVCLSVLAWVAYCDVGWSTGSPSKPTTERVVFWNIGRNLVDDVEQVDEFLNASPLIVGLVETGDLSKSWLDDWRARWPGYQFAKPSSGCLLIVRGEILSSGYEPLGQSSAALWVDCNWQGERVRAVVVDFVANPWISRQEPLRRLTGLVRAWSDLPLVVMGDFNTPDDSVWFDELHHQLHEVFSIAGSGYAPTWPWPMPVLKLDQMWINEWLRVQQAWRTTTGRSDHRPIWAKVSLDED